MNIEDLLQHLYLIQFIILQSIIPQSRQNKTREELPHSCRTDQSAIGSCILVKQLPTGPTVALVVVLFVAQKKT